MKHAYARLRLADYYAIEGVNSFGCTLFLTCVMFWTRQRFGYTDAWNLALNALQGITYIIASRAGGVLADRVGYDRQMLAALACAALALILGWLPETRYAPFAVMVLYTAAMGATWPALEAVILHVPGTLTMPQRVGIYNMTWSLCGALGVFISGPLFAWRPSVIFWLPGVLHVGQALWIRLHTRRAHLPQTGRNAMDIPHRGNHVPRARKRHLLYTAWLANAVGYLLCAAFIALAPFVGARLGLSVTSAIWLVSVYLITRGAGFVLFWRWEGWHYHAGWNVSAALLTPLCVAVIFVVPHVALVVPALMLFGLSHSLSYAGSLYYSVDCGEEKGAHSGLHEAIIGMGICAGPLAGALGAALWRTPHAAEWTVLALAGLVTLGGLAWLHRPRMRQAPE